MYFTSFRFSSLFHSIHKSGATSSRFHVFGSRRVRRRCFLRDASPILMESLNYQDASSSRRIPSLVLALHLILVLVVYSTSSSRSGATSSVSCDCHQTRAVTMISSRYQSGPFLESSDSSERCQVSANPISSRRSSRRYPAADC